MPILCTWPSLPRMLCPFRDGRLEGGSVTVTELICFRHRRSKVHVSSIPEVRNQLRSLQVMTFVAT